jgi:hypothetical protein
MRGHTYRKIYFMPYSFPDKYNPQQVNAGEWSGWRYSGQVSLWIANAEAVRHPCH